MTSRRGRSPKAYKYVVNYTRQNKPVGRLFNDSKAVLFTNVEKSLGKKDHSRISGYRCNEMVHYTSDCPPPTMPDTKFRIDRTYTLMMPDENSGEDDNDSVHKLYFYQGEKYINPKWVLLDNQSTVDIFFNPELLTDIHESRKSINIHCTAGTRCITHVGTLKKYGGGNKGAITNILSLLCVQ
jgi:rhodanese-related sulfurtransferase